MMEICAGVHDDSSRAWQIPHKPHPLAGLSVYSFNGKPQATVPRFACACGAPLNENAEHLCSPIRTRGLSF